MGSCTSSSSSQPAAPARPDPSAVLTGMFASLTDHTGLGLTLADLSLAEGGGLMLTIPVSAIPEVGTILPALGAALAAGWRLRRKWRARQAC